MINKPRKQSMRQVRDEALTHSPTYQRAVDALDAAIKSPLSRVPVEKPVFVRGARVKLVKTV